METKFWSGSDRKSGVSVGVTMWSSLQTIEEIEDVCVQSAGRILGKAYREFNKARSQEGAQ